MSWAVAVVGGVGAIASAGSGIYGANEASKAAKGAAKFRVGDATEAYKLENAYRPLYNSSGLEQLVGQSAYGLGADPESIGLEIMLRQIESSSNPQRARVVQRQIRRIQALSLQQQTSPTPETAKNIAKVLQDVNKQLTSNGGGAGALGGGAFISINAAGQLTTRFANEGLNAILDRARQDSAMIRENRLTAEANLSKLTADFPMATAGDIERLTAEERKSQERELNQRYGTETERILQLANTRGFNPAGILGELEKNRSDALFDTQFTAADRVLQRLGGQQGLAKNSMAGINLGLAPDRQIALLNALQSQQTPSTGQLAMTQAQNQAAAGRSAAASITAGYGQVSDSINDATAATMYGLREWEKQREKQRLLNLGTGPAT